MFGVQPNYRPRYRFFLEQKYLTPSTINLRLRHGAVP